MPKESSSGVLNKLARQIAVEVELEREALALMMLEAYLRGGREGTKAAL